ncbi:MAG: hypothetical protein CM15mP49_02190 [Actinomycetota bacterium]|nr:MAG: hypothetical protein CM15mP49_02190 [Actinomycetota bacterium]
MEQLNNEIELPLINVLAEMEFSGIQVDLEGLKRLRDRLESEVSNARKGSSISWARVQCEFNETVAASSVH